MSKNTLYLESYGDFCWFDANFKYQDYELSTTDLATQVIFENLKKQWSFLNDNQI